MQHKQAQVPERGCMTMMTVPLHTWSYHAWSPYIRNPCVGMSIDPSHKSHNAPVLYPTVHNFVTEMCTCVHISVTQWCIVGYLSDALWDLWDGAIAHHIIATFYWLTAFNSYDWLDHHTLKYHNLRLLEKNITRKLLSLSLDLFFKILLFQVTFLISFSTAIFSPYFLQVGLLLQHVALFQSGN